MAEEAANPAVSADALPQGAVPSQEYVDKVTSTQLTDQNPILKPEGPQRPEGVPEQFWDAEKGAVKTDDLVKSYTELRAKMDGNKPAEEPKPEDEAKDPKGVKLERPEDAQKKPEGEANPLTTAVDVMAKAYAETGEVTDEQIKAVEDLGLPRGVIDTYLAGVKALEAAMTSEVYKAAGGEEKFTEAQTWAAKSLSDADLEYYNANIDDPSKRVQTVEWLMAKFAAGRPSEGSLVNGLPSTAASGDVFETPQQVQAAMADPRYQTEPSYRKQIAEKLLRSQRAGTYSGAAQLYTR